MLMKSSDLLLFQKEESLDVWKKIVQCCIKRPLSP